MAKPRVYELAKVLNVDSKTVLEKLKDMGEFVKSASSTIEPPVARRLKAEFAKDNAKGDSKPVQQRRRPHLRPRLPLHLPHRLRPLPHVRHRLPRHISRLRLRVHRHRVRRAAHAPACRPRPPRSERQRENGRDNREGRENGVRVARTIAVTTIVVTTRAVEQWPAGSASEQPRQCFGSAPHAQGGAGANGGNAASNAIPRPHAQGPRPGNNPFSRKQGMHTPTPGDNSASASDGSSDC